MKLEEFTIEVEKIIEKCRDESSPYPHQCGISLLVIASNLLYISLGTNEADKVICNVCREICVGVEEIRGNINT